MFLRFSYSYCITWAIFNTWCPQATVKYLLFLPNNCQNLSFRMDHKIHLYLKGVKATSLKSESEGKLYIVPGQNHLPKEENRKKSVFLREFRSLVSSQPCFSSLLPQHLMSFDSAFSHHQEFCSITLTCTLCCRTWQ